MPPLPDTLRAFTATVVLILLAILSAPTCVRAAADGYEIIPEYERTLATLLLTLESSTEDLSLQEGIIRNLPKYTKTLLLLPEQLIDEMSVELKRLNVIHSVTLIPFSSPVQKKLSGYVLTPHKEALKKSVVRNMPMPRGSVWTQDLLEVMRAPDGTSVLLLPFIHKYFRPRSNKPMTLELSDNVFLEKLGEFNYEVKRLPVTFKGGNVLVDRLQGEPIALAGRDVLRESALVLQKARGMNVSPEDISTQLREDLHVSRLFVLGKATQQPDLLFHLDQAIVLLPGGIAGVTRVIDEQQHGYDRKVSEVTRFLNEVRQELVAIGYRVVDIWATVDDVKNYRYYVNGIPYVNQESGRREFMLPVFENSFDDINLTVFSHNVDVIESLGYRVIEVPTSANNRNGGIHCIVNVLE